MQPKLRGLVFDKDGTLFHFQKTWGQSTYELIADLSGGDPVLMERLGEALTFDIETRLFRPLRPVIAGTGADVVDLLAAELPGWSRREITRKIDASVDTTVQVEAVPLKPYLSDLRERGLALGVATNDSERAARAHLDSVGILDFFDFVAGYDSGHGGKPGPGMIEAFLSHMSLARDEVAMIGDSLTDMNAGLAAGVRRIGVLSGPASEADLAPRADHVFPDIGHIPALL